MIVPRDRSGEFEPQLVKKHQMDITKIEDKIIGLYGCGMSTRDISDNIKEIYGFEVSAETISNITRQVLTDVKEWQSRALKPVYAVVFMDGMVLSEKGRNSSKMYSLRMHWSGFRWTKRSVKPSHWRH